MAEKSDVGPQRFCDLVAKFQPSNVKMALSVAIIGSNNTPLFISVSEKEQLREFELNMFVYCSLDIVEERLEGISKAQELFLGSLFADQKFKSYGYVSNTNIKMVLVTDIGDVTLKDQDIRAIFKKLHAAYCDALSNPFYTPGEPIKSKFLDEAAREIFSRKATM